MKRDKRVLVSWSGGKDSAMALYEILRDQKRYHVSALLTTVTEGYDRISMHGVRRSLLDQQARALGLPLEVVYISPEASNEEYENKMQGLLEKYKTHGVTAVIFGDIYLQDIRTYREDNLRKVEMEGVFPLWGRDTGELVEAFVNLGFKGISTCVDSRTLEKKFVGKELDKQFFKNLPDEVDVCGENGEYHTFVYDGPIFKQRVKFSAGEVVLREERFYYCDLIDVEI